MKTLTVDESAQVLGKIFSQMNERRGHTHFETDQGPEFSDGLLPFLEKWQMSPIKLQGQHKASLAERVIRTMQERLERFFDSRGGKRRWVDQLQNLVNNYNNTVHSTIKMKPNEVTIEDEDRLFKEALAKSSKKKHFEKSEKSKNSKCQDGDGLDLLPIMAEKRKQPRSDQAESDAEQAVEKHVHSTPGTPQDPKNNSAAIKFRPRSATYPGVSFTRLEKSPSFSWSIEAQPSSSSPRISLNLSSSSSSVASEDASLALLSASSTSDGKADFGGGGAGDLEAQSQKSPMAICCFINHILCDRDNHIQLNLKPLSFVIRFLSPHLLCALVTLANVAMLIKLIYETFVVKNP
ncbi:unnamed protein product [Oikopleura dioica]|uniref:Integrase catalytic domain-containing protein n=1 Tax=Oikopleura dioica TaxID=34765 RepID=E4Y0C7_OIKDI|nr:unnamed protein product [Oikopleura dioica]